MNKLTQSKQPLQELTEMRNRQISDAVSQVSPSPHPPNVCHNEHVLVHVHVEYLPKILKHIHVHVVLIYMYMYM